MHKADASRNRVPTVVPSVPLQGVDCSFLLAPTPPVSIVIFLCLTTNCSLACPDSSLLHPGVVVICTEVDGLLLPVKGLMESVVLPKACAMLTSKLL